jgi:hypothetical protein
MNAVRVVVVIACLLSASMPVLASGPLGICAVIERVEFEPGADAPEHVRLHGAFAFYDGSVGQPAGFTAPVRGYLYFRLPTRADAELARREWADLAAVAGTGEAVAFGAYGYIGEFENITADSLGNTGAGGYTLGFGLGVQAVRPDSLEAADPAEYIPGDMGVVRLGTGNYDDIVTELKALLDR